MQGYDQLIMITENHINEQFDFLWADPKTELKRMDVHVGSRAIQSSLSAPVVKFVVEDQVERVYFFIKFGTGTMEYEDGTGATGKIVVDGWSLAFAVDFGMDMLKQVPDSVRSRIQLASRYTVSQLLFMFSNANISTFAERHSSHPGFEKAKDMDAADFLDLYLKKFLRGLIDRGLNTLGYAVIVDNPDDKEPTVPPQRVKHQTLADRASDGKFTTETGRNLFVFAEMVKDHQFPGGPSSKLEWSSNWVTAEIAGTMAISKGVFFDIFLSHNLRPVVVAAVEVLHNVSYWMEEKGEQGQDWKITKTKPDFSSFALIPEKDGLSFSWTPEKNVIGLGYGITMTLVAEVKANFRYAPGTNTIKLSGTSKLEVSKLTTTSSEPGQSSSRIEKDVARIEWNYTMIMRSVLNGQVEIFVSADEGFPKVIPEAEAYHGPLSLIFGPSKREQAAQQVKESIINHLDSKQMTKTISDAVNSYKSFTLPGNGTFAFRDMVFSQEGALLFSLNYKA